MAVSHRHAAGFPTDALIVALEEVVGHDPTLRELADLPCGWFAERDTVGSPWKRAQR